MECRDRLPQLVIERRSHPQGSSGDLDIKLHQKDQSQHSVHASIYSPDESDSDSDMDRRLKRGRGGRRRRSRQNQRAPTISSAKQRQQVTGRKEEERPKAEVHITYYQYIQIQHKIMIILCKLIGRSSA